jgi:hypothetical protein
MENRMATTIPPAWCGVETSFCGDQRLWPDRLESVGRRTPPPNPSLGLTAPGRVPLLREPAA